MVTCHVVITSYHHYPSFLILTQEALSVDRISDGEIHAIVERVVRRTLGLGGDSAPAAQPAAPAVKDPAAVAVPAVSVPAPAPAPAAQAGGRKVVAIGADHGGFELKDVLKKDLAEMGFEVVDCGTYNKDAVDYPDYALEVAHLVSIGKAWRGVMIDGAGIGSCMTANKVPGVRAAMCYDHATAVNSREHNDANLLTLGAGLLGTALAKQIMKTWLTTEFGGGRHAKRVDKIVAIEQKYLKGK